jgi:hypothetical protein
MNTNDTNDTRPAKTPAFGLKSLFALHMFVVLQVSIMLGLGHGLAQAFLPPWMLTQAAGLIVRAPTFAMLSLVAAAMACAVAFIALRRALRHTGRWPRLLASTLAIMWTPLLCGEIVRIALMEPALGSARIPCRDSMLLIQSIRSHLSGGRPRTPHAWIVQGEEVRLWSYRTLRFESASNWSGATAARMRCAYTPAPGVAR